VEFTSIVCARCQLDFTTAAVKSDVYNYCLGPSLVTHGECGSRISKREGPRSSATGARIEAPMGYRVLLGLGSVPLPEKKIEFRYQIFDFWRIQGAFSSSVSWLIECILIYCAACTWRGSAFCWRKISQFVVVSLQATHYGRILYGFVTFWKSHSSGSHEFLRFPSPLLLWKAKFADDFEFFWLFSISY